MQAVINLITIWTEDIDRMREFYREVLGFAVLSDRGNYVEFASEGVRLAICRRAVMMGYSTKYSQPATGQAFELAFPCASPAEVDSDYARLVAGGAAPVCPPQNMPWGQRTALLADPDGNIHEIFAELG